MSYKKDPLRFVDRIHIKEDNNIFVRISQKELTAGNVERGGCGGQRLVPLYTYIRYDKTSVFTFEKKI